MKKTSDLFNLSLEHAVLTRRVAQLETELGLRRDNSQSFTEYFTDRETGIAGHRKETVAPGAEKTEVTLTILGGGGTTREQLLEALRYAFDKDTQ